jgi:hypothetical protein
LLPHRGDAVAVARLEYVQEATDLSHHDLSVTTLRVVSGDRLMSAA